MPKQYNQLTLSERDKISAMLYERYSLSQIGLALGRSKSTISREIRRNASPEYQCYLSHRAHGRAEQRRTKSSSRPRLKNKEIRTFVESRLREGWSPEQIAGRLSRVHPHLSISHEAIYQYIYDAKTPSRLELIGWLRRAHRKRKNKGIGRKARKTKIPNRISIEQRPVSVETRKQAGHWEGDCLVSRKSQVALHSLVERKSRFVMLTQLKRKSASETTKAIILRLKRLPLKARRTLTLDNGTENAGHEDITKNIGIQCYFTHPYASWERGTNENTNGLIRWYLPKGTDFSKIDKDQLKLIEHLINSRPRKCLAYKTPFEVAASSVALTG
jgi:IS30 family transposase